MHNTHISDPEYKQHDHSKQSRQAHQLLSKSLPFLRDDGGAASRSHHLHQHKTDLHIDTSSTTAMGVHSLTQHPGEDQDAYLSSMFKDQLSCDTRQGSSNASNEPMPVPRNSQATSGLITADTLGRAPSPPLALHQHHDVRHLDLPAHRVDTLSSSPPSSLSPLTPMSSTALDVSGSAPLAGRTRPPLQHKKSHLTRRARSLATSPLVNANSWDHIKSPAASFLAGFAMSNTSDPDAQEEQEGDEMDDYVMEKVIGYGGFGTVRRGYCISNGQKVAIKVFRRAGATEDELNRMDREITLWKMLDHPRVVRVHKVLETDAASYVVSDYCGRGNLLELMEDHADGLYEDEVRRLFLPLCEGVAYLHDKARICHKDLKLENILIDEEGHLKICDFGLAMHMMPMQYQEKCEAVAGGSLPYAAPEQIKTTAPIVSSQVDMWALGVILYALRTGHLPFEDSYEPRLQQKIVRGEYEMPSNTSDAFQQVISHLLQVEPEDRWSIQQVLQCPWITHTSSLM
ncbi:kinase-like domain-containing protein [Syncephalastrum racemosum]|uniref:Kinase-like domain-containing protein n=1 Tax=Syncephalastrum racemosum TaxID=13706 RepID=A0A1X2HFP8_SYNRA|nr:kinase-like domain-containing protein [Syncephalastrum racemosum]